MTGKDIASLFFVNLGIDDFNIQKRKLWWTKKKKHFMKTWIQYVCQ